MQKRNGGDTAHQQVSITIFECLLVLVLVIEYLYCIILAEPALSRVADDEKQAS